MFRRKPRLPDVPALYEKLRASGMNDWVGGADPEQAGQGAFDILVRHAPIGYDTRLLDFGCGIGRVALGVLKHRPLVKSLIGVDIVPKMVAFCRETIGAPFPQTQFDLLADRNEHYERYKAEAGELGVTAKSREELIAAHGGQIDLAYAFSVFTHIDREDFGPLLQLVGSLLKPGGSFVFTAFLLTPLSRERIAAEATQAQFPQPAFEGEDVFVGNTADRLAFIAYDMRLMDRMIAEAGLVQTAVDYGDWRGGGLSLSWQDVVVCRKPLAAPAQAAAEAATS